MKLKQKLKSTTGASLIIALVFMMFCTFVGGAVLAASTANAGRIKSLKADEQAYLDQRSAAQLIMDELVPQGSSGMNLNFSVNKDVETKYNAELTQTGAMKKTSSIPTVTPTVTVETANPVLTTPMQRILHEWAFLSFMKQNDIDLNEIVYPADGVLFTYSPEGKDPEEVETAEDFWLYSKFGRTDFECSMEISIAKDGSAFGNELTAQFSCDYEKPESPKIVISVGEDAVTSVVMAGIASKREQNYPESPTQIGNDNFLISYKTTVTTVSWVTPVIVKGAGA